MYRLLLVSAMLLCLPCAAFAQQRVADLNTGPDEVETRSNPGKTLKVTSTKNYFVAFTPEFGYELWRTDGSFAGTVRVSDICPGECSSFPYNMTLINGKVYMAATDGQTGYEPWVINVADDSIVRLSDFNLGAEGSYPRDFVESPLNDGSVVFAAKQGADPNYSLLGLTRGLVGDVAGLVPNMEWPGKMVRIGSALFVAGAARNSRDYQLRRITISAQTAANTIVRTIRLGQVSAGIQNLSVLNGRLWFSADDGISGREPYVSDGTSGGTLLVKDINVGAEGSIPDTFSDENTVFRTFASKVYFAADNLSGQGSNIELFGSDGTTAGTAIVKEINPSLSAGSFPSGILASNGSLIFVAFDGSATDLYKSDGTAVGTTKIVTNPRLSYGLDLSPSEQPIREGSFYYGLTAGHIFRTDGTAAGTREIVNNDGGCCIEDLSEGNGNVYFSKGSELMRAPINAPNSYQLVRDLNDSIGNSTPGFFTPFNNKTLFFGYSDPNGYQPYSINTPTAAPTALNVSELNLTSTFRGPVVNAGSRIYFRDIDDLWITDGSAFGTQRVFTTRDFNLEGSQSIRTVCKIPDADGVLFSAPTRDTDGDGRGDSLELWISDGSAAGTRRVPQLLANDFDYEPLFDAQFRCIVFGDFVLVEGEIFSQGPGTEPHLINWRTGASSLVRDIAPGSASSAIDNVVVVGSNFYFTAEQSRGDRELWRSNGTAQGTIQLGDINPNGASNPKDFLAVGNTLYFTAFNPSTGRELYRTDGTVAGTVLVKDLLIQSSDGIVGAPVLSGSTIYFAGLNAGTSRPSARLYKTDGTANGTVEVSNFQGSDVGDFPLHLYGLGDGRVVYSGFDVANGRELWISDGTAAGTRRISNIAPGNRHANPSKFMRNGNLLYFSADDQSTGREPYVLDLNALDAFFKNGFE
jgi:trimeric autotransporter adhesin